MPLAHTLGSPPLGANRELKRATEGYWSGKVARDALLHAGAELRAAHWRLQRDAGLDLVPVNDFSHYDRVLDTCALVGAVPERYGWPGGTVDLDTYFAMARGSQGRGRDVTAMEMTKWFDTNYHYIVPEFVAGQQFTLSATKPVDEFREARALGIAAKPVLVGPVTFLLLGKTRAGRFDRLSLLDALLPVYADALSRLAAAGATWVQLDEPCLALDRTAAERDAYARAYRFLAERAPGVKILLATYFEGLGDNLETARGLPVAGLHVDLVRAPRQLDAILAAWPAGRVLSLGVVDGRNIWKADLARALEPLERARDRIDAERVGVAPSCSLLHVPLDLDLERRLDGELKGWLAFAKQKLAEVVALTRAVRDGRAAAPGRGGLDDNAAAIAGRRASRRIHDPAVPRRAAAVAERVHGARVGTVVRHGLRQAADHLRRRVAAAGDDRAMEQLRPVADEAAGEGDAHRPGHDPAVVFRARRSAARRDGEAARARDPRRSGRPRARRDSGHPDRRARPARGAAAAARRLAGVPRLGGERLSARHRRSRGRHADPHPHVLQRVQRRRPRDRADGCGRDLDRERALRLRAARRVPRVQVPQRDRTRGLRHPLAAGAAGGGDRAPARRNARGADRPPDLGEPGLRPQDPRLGGDAAVAQEPRRRGAADAGRRGVPLTGVGEPPILRS